ncbi:MAG: PCRF domain-containing protein, partial [Gemmobacter sp.]
MLPADKLDQIVQRFDFVEARLAAGAAPAEIAALSREHSELAPVVATIAAWKQARADIAEAEAMLADPEMRALAEEELPGLRARLPAMEQALRVAAYGSVISPRSGVSAEEPPAKTRNVPRGVSQRFAFSSNTASVSG